MGTAGRPARLDHKDQQIGNVSVEKAAVGAVDVEAKVTVYVVLACTIAASGGVLFGYDGEDTPFLCTASNHSCILDSAALYLAMMLRPMQSWNHIRPSHHTSTHSFCLQGASLGVLKACNNLLKCGESTVQQGRRMHACWHV